MELGLRFTLCHLNTPARYVIAFYSVRRQRVNTIRLNLWKIFRNTRDRANKMDSNELRTTHPIHVWLREICQGWERLVLRDSLVTIR